MYVLTKNHHFFLYNHHVRAHLDFLSIICTFNSYKCIINRFLSSSISTNSVLNICVLSFIYTLSKSLYIFFIFSTPLLNNISFRNTPHDFASFFAFLYEFSHSYITISIYISLIFFYTFI